MPDFSNDIIKEVLKKYGNFIYDSSQNEDLEAIDFSSFKLKDNAVYKGQWKNGLKNGRGK